MRNLSGCSVMNAKHSQPLDLAQFDGHTRKLSTLAHNLVSDAANNQVSDLLLAQEVRDTAEATEEACGALLAECRRLREQAMADRAFQSENARLRASEARLMEVLRGLIAAVEFVGVQADQYNAICKARAALAGGKL